MTTLDLDDECRWLLEELAKQRGLTQDELVSALLCAAGDELGVYWPGRPEGGASITMTLEGEEPAVGDVSLGELVDLVLDDPDGKRKTRLFVPEKPQP